MGDGGQVGITIDRVAAARRLEEAIAWARSDRDVPEEWREAATTMELAPVATYTPALATGMLARATDGRVDALSIKETYGARTYSQRSLCHGLLVPASREHGFGLRASGREPLNNQPFFRYDHISEIDRVQRRARPFLNQLRAYLEALNDCDQDEALAALAAFLRVRFELAAAVIHHDLSDALVGLMDLLEVVDLFLAEDVDRPRRTQAFVAAVLSAVYPNVRTRRLHDPSRDFPGDVQATDSQGRVIVSAEARAKPVNESDVRTFAAALGAHSIGRGFVVAIDPDHEPLPQRTLQRWAWDEHRVVLHIFESSRELVEGALAWSASEAHAALAEFPEQLARQLEFIEATPESQERWTALCRAVDESMPET